MTDPEVREAIGRFVEGCSQPSGEVALPSGVYVMDFHAAPGVASQLTSR